MCMLNHVQLFVTLWTAAHQAPLSMRFPRQEYWLPNHSPLNLSEGWGHNSRTWPTLGLWKIMQARLGWDITCLLKEMKRCMPKSVNYDKVWEVTQEKDEGWSDHQEATQAQISVSFVGKEGTGRRNVLNAPSVGCWKGNPNQPLFPATLSQMRDPLALTDGAKSLPTSRSHSTHPHYSIGSPSTWQIGGLNIL